jgi:hypothetical protein
MSIPELARMFRRHWVAMLIVVIVTGAVALNFRHTTPLSQDSGNVAFSVAPGLATGLETDTLIITADTMVRWLNGPQGASSVLRQGGTDDYQFGLVNFYDQEYPVYAVPMATLTTTSYDPAVAQRTFNAAFHAIQQKLQTQQLIAGVPRGARVSASVVGSSTGPVTLDGSHKRTYAGLALLALMVAYFTGRLLDRHPSWRALLRPSLRGPSRFRIPARSVHSYGDPARRV